MEKTFNKLSESLFTYLKNNEHLIITLDAENSQFIRFNKASVRQTGLVDDASIGLKYIANGRTCRGAFTVSGQEDVD